MAEKKNRKQRRAISATRAKYVEALGLESTENPVVTFDGLDGEVYSFPHPLYMDDEVAEAMEAGGGQVETVKVLLGEEQWERYTAHPEHRAMDVMLIFREVGEETQAVMGDGTPTRSSTS